MNRVSDEHTLVTREGRGGSVECPTGDRSWFESCRRHFASELLAIPLTPLYHSECFFSNKFTLLRSFSV